MVKKVRNLCDAVGKIYLGDWIIDFFDDEVLKKKIHKQADIELNSLVRNKKISLQSRQRFNFFLSHNCTGVLWWKFL